MQKESRYLSLFTIALLVFAASACDLGPPEIGPSTAPTKPSEESGGTTPEPPAEPAERAEAIGGLKEELYFAASGAGGTACFAFASDVSSSLPAIVGIDAEYAAAHGVGVGTDVGDLCLFGFPSDEEITVNVSLPNGDRFSRILGPPHDDEDGVFSFGEIEGVSLTSVDLWQPAGLPQGTWTAEASSATAYAEHSFNVRYKSPMISAIPAGVEVNPLEIYDYHSYSYLAGEVIDIRGAAFPPNRDLPLGIYYCEVEYCYESNWAGSLVHSTMVTTDGQGDFSVAVQIEPSDPPGRNQPCYPIKYNC